MKTSVKCTPLGLAILAVCVAARLTAQPPNAAEKARPAAEDGR